MYIGNESAYNNKYIILYFIRSFFTNDTIFARNYTWNISLSPLVFLVFSNQGSGRYLFLSLFNFLIEGTCVLSCFWYFLEVQSTLRQQIESFWEM